MSVKPGLVCVRCGRAPYSSGDTMALAEGVGALCTLLCVGSALDDLGDGTYAVKIARVGWLERLAGKSHYTIGAKTLCGLAADGPEWWAWEDEPKHPCRTCLSRLPG